MTRQTKTPRQRAQEALDVEDRRVKKLRAKHADLEQETSLVAAELAAATARRDHLKKHPDLAAAISVSEVSTPRVTGSTHTSTPSGGTTP